MVEQVQVPHSVVQDKVPLPANLVQGGLAANLKDFRLYSKGYDGVVIRMSGRAEVHDDTVTDATVYIPWVKQVVGNLDVFVSSSRLTFNPSNGRLSATSFAGAGGALTGFTSLQITDALGYDPVEPIGSPLAPVATDLPTVIALANSLRTALIASGIGS
jgi:hypothetical protein